jgi:peptidoglycan/LPS O-acetylase OafA/YrhL
VRTPVAGPAEVGRWARLLRSGRRRFAALAIVVAVVGGVAIAHSGLTIDHVGDGTDMCLAVLNVGLLAIAVKLLRRRAKPALSRHPTLLPRPIARMPATSSPVEVRSRAGPAELQVFRS